MARKKKEKPKSECVFWQNPHVYCELVKRLEAENAELKAALGKANDTGISQKNKRNAD